ncbi:MAG: transposase [Bacteroidota bacterium]
MGVFKSLWQSAIKEGKVHLQLRTAQLDGSHTPCFRGGEAVGYQGRKRRKTCNMLYITDEQGLVLGSSNPKSGNHHDVHQIQKSFLELIEQLEELALSLDGLIINADSGFDSQELRLLCQEKGIECNFDLNPRKGQTSDREEYFDEEFYKVRFVIERSFAWLDAFKALLIRYEKTARN